ncbi:MAG: hypothetical protein R6U38_09065 [Desulfatiglandaceae bacterium]
MSLPDKCLLMSLFLLSLTEAVIVITRGNRVHALKGGVGLGERFFSAISMGLKSIWILPMECLIMSSATLMALRKTSFARGSSS